MVWLRCYIKLLNRKDEQFIRTHLGIDKMVDISQTFFDKKCILIEISLKFISNGSINKNVITMFILCMRPTNERWRYNVTSSLIGWTHS